MFRQNFSKTHVKIGTTINEALDPRPNVKEKHDISETIWQLITGYILGKDGKTRYSLKNELGGWTNENN